jgi:hypothetical protein
LLIQKRLSYKFEDNILFLKVKGDYSEEEVIQLIKKAMNDTSIPERFPVLVDARLSEVKHKINEQEKIRKEFAEWLEKVMCSADVVQSDLHFGLSRQLSVFEEFEGREAEAFREMEPALAWIKEKMKADKSLEKGPQNSVRT